MNMDGKLKSLAFMWSLCIWGEAEVSNFTKTELFILIPYERFFKCLGHRNWMKFDEKNDFQPTRVQNTTNRVALQEAKIDIFKFSSSMVNVTWNCVVDVSNFVFDLEMEYWLQKNWSDCWKKHLTIPDPEQFSRDFVLRKLKLFYWVFMKNILLNFDLAIYVKRVLVPV